MEQNRKKNQVRFLEDASHNVETQQPSILSHPWFNDERYDKVVVKRPAFVEGTDLDRLFREKANLEEESRHSDEEIEALELRARILCEKIVKEMKRRNSEKRRAIGEFRDEIGIAEALYRLESKSERLKKGM